MIIGGRPLRDQGRGGDGGDTPRPERSSRNGGQGEGNNSRSLPADDATGVEAITTMSLLDNEVNSDQQDAEVQRAERRRRMLGKDSSSARTMSPRTVSRALSVMDEVVPGGRAAPSGKREDLPGVERWRYPENDNAAPRLRRSSHNYDGGASARRDSRTLTNTHDALDKALAAMTHITTQQEELQQQRLNSDRAREAFRRASAAVAAVGGGAAAAQAAGAAASAAIVGGPGGAAEGMLSFQIKRRSSLAQTAQHAQARATLALRHQVRDDDENRDGRVRDAVMRAMEQRELRRVAACVVQRLVRRWRLLPRTSASPVSVRAGKAAEARLAKASQAVRRALRKLIANASQSAAAAAAEEGKAPNAPSLAAASGGPAGASRRIGFLLGSGGTAPNGRHSRDEGSVDAAVIEGEARPGRRGSERSRRESFTTGGDAEDASRRQTIRFGSDAARAAASINAPPHEACPAVRAMKYWAAISARHDGVSFGSQPKNHPQQRNAEGRMRGEGDDDTPETDEADGEPTVSVVIRGVRRGRDLQRADTAAATEDINKNSPKPSQTAGAATSAFTLLAAPSSNPQSLDGAAEAPAPGQAAEVATVAPPVLVKSESPMMKMKGGLAFAGTMLAMASRVKAKARRAKLVVAARTSVAGGALLQPWLVTMGNELCVEDEQSAQHQLRAPRQSATNLSHVLAQRRTSTGAPPAAGLAIEAPAPSATLGRKGSTQGEPASEPHSPLTPSTPTNRKSSSSDIAAPAGNDRKSRTGMRRRASVQGAVAAAQVEAAVDSVVSGATPNKAPAAAAPESVAVAMMRSSLSATTTNGNPRRRSADVLSAMGYRAVGEGTDGQPLRKVLVLRLRNETVTPSAGTAAATAVPSPVAQKPASSPSGASGLTAALGRRLSSGNSSRQLQIDLPAAATPVIPVTSDMIVARLPGVYRPPPFAWAATEIAAAVRGLIIRAAARRVREAAARECISIKLGALARGVATRVRWGDVVSEARAYGLSRLVAERSRKEEKRAEKRREARVREDGIDAMARVGSQVLLDEICLTFARTIARSAQREVVADFAAAAEAERLNAEELAATRLANETARINALARFAKDGVAATDELQDPSSPLRSPNGRRRSLKSISSDVRSLKSIPSDVMLQVTLAKGAVDTVAAAADNGSAIKPGWREAVDSNGHVRSYGTDDGTGWVLTRRPAVDASSYFDRQEMSVVVTSTTDGGGNVGSESEFDDDGSFSDTESSDDGNDTVTTGLTSGGDGSSALRNATARRERLQRKKTRAARRLARRRARRQLRHQKRREAERSAAGGGGPHVGKLVTADSLARAARVQNAKLTLVRLESRACPDILRVDPASVAAAASVSAVSGDSQPTSISGAVSIATSVAGDGTHASHFRKPSPPTAVVLAASTGRGAGGRGGKKHNPYVRFPTTPHAAAAAAVAAHIAKGNNSNGSGTHRSTGGGSDGDHKRAADNGGSSRVNNSINTSGTAAYRGTALTTVSPPLSRAPSPTLANATASAPRPRTAVETSDIVHVSAAVAAMMVGGVNGGGGTAVLASLGGNGGGVASIGNSGDGGGSIRADGGGGRDDGLIYMCGSIDSTQRSRAARSDRTGATTAAGVPWVGGGGASIASVGGGLSALTPFSRPTSSSPPMAKFGGGFRGGGTGGSAVADAAVAAAAAASPPTLCLLPMPAAHGAEEDGTQIEGVVGVTGATVLEGEGNNGKSSTGRPVSSVATSVETRASAPTVSRVGPAGRAASTVPAPVETRASAPVSRVGGHVLFPAVSADAEAAVVAANAAAEAAATRRAARVQRAAERVAQKPDGVVDSGGEGRQRQSRGNGNRSAAPSPCSSPIFFYCSEDESEDDGAHNELFRPGSKSPSPSRSPSPPSPTLPLYPISSTMDGVANSRGSSKASRCDESVVGGDGEAALLNAGLENSAAAAAEREDDLSLNTHGTCITMSEASLVAGGGRGASRARPRPLSPPPPSALPAVVSGGYGGKRETAEACDGVGCENVMMSVAAPLANAPVAFSRNDTGWLPARGGGTRSPRAAVRARQALSPEVRVAIREYMVINNTCWKEYF